MGIFKRNEPTTDPRDMAAGNPTGRVRRSSSKSRRQAANRMERDLEGTQHERKDKPKG